MTAITLRQIPEELHREIKRLQLDLEEKGEKKSLEEIYMYLIELGLVIIKKQNPTNYAGFFFYFKSLNLRILFFPG
jgi:hypothetical protein